MEALGPEKPTHTGIIFFPPHLLHDWEKLRKLLFYGWQLGFIQENQQSSKK